MPRLHTSALSEFTRFVDETGLAIDGPEVRARYEPLVLAYDTVVDTTLDPFSPAYFAQQVALYEEISGRTLDQATGELHGDELAPLLTAPNPTGIPDATTVADYVRCTSTMLSLAALGPRPRILDLGAGHGLGSEVFAYAGCAVHAVDIDVGLGALARARAAKLGLDIVRSDLNFDDLGIVEDGAYDAAFFFQALHHCLRPWEIIGALRRKLMATGVIGFVGEPIQEEWWESWGVRLDAESLYVARARGWFECGWSARFIDECFARNGMTLTLFTGGYLGGTIGIATADEGKRAAVIARARTLGLAERYASGVAAISDDLFASTIGEATTLLGRPAFRQVADGREALVHGPYVTLEPGRYEVTLFVQRSARAGSGLRTALVLDVACEAGSVRLYRARLRGGFGRGVRRIVRRFTVPRLARRLEVRLFVTRGRWTASVPSVRRLDEDEAHG